MQKSRSISTQEVFQKKRQKGDRKREKTGAEKGASREKRARDLLWEVCCHSNPVPPSEKTEEE